MRKGKKRRSTSKTKRLSRDRSDSDSNSSSESGFRRANVSPRLNRPDGSDGSATREKFKKSSARLRAKAEARRKKIKESLRTGRLEPGLGVSARYNRTTVSTKSDSADSGVRMRSIFHAEDGAHRLRIKSLKIAEASDFKNTIDTLPDVLADQVENGVDLRKVEISINGIADADKLARGLEELGENDPEVSFGFQNIHKEHQTLENGFDGIKGYLMMADGNPMDSDVMKTIEGLITQAQGEQKRAQQSILEIDNVAELHQKIKSKIETAINEAGSEGNKNFLNGLKVAVEFETKREAIKLSSSVDKINEIDRKITDNFQNLRLNFPEIQPKALVMLGKIDILANAAELTASDIDSLFTQVPVIHPVTTNEIMIGGEMAAFFKKYYNNENPNQLDADTLDDLFRDEFSSALRRMFKRVNKENLPAGFFKNSFINKSTSDTNILVPDGFQQVEQQELNRFGRWKLNRELKNHRKIKTFEALDGATASDVYRVTTKGPIGQSGVNEGFAKKATSAGDEINDGVDKLNFASHEEGQKKILDENPTLIARQVVASRLAERMGFDGIASEIFSEAPEDKTIIGISGKVPGLALKDVDVREKIMHRNFDFKNAATQKSMAEMQLFDALIGQVDRHGGNIFIDPNTGKAYGIDGDLVLPRGINMIDKEKHYNDDTALKGQFERGPKGELIYASNLMDVEMRDKVRSIDPEEIEGILKGRSNDPEKLDDDRAIHYAKMRYNAILRKVKEMENQGTLIKKWDDSTYEEAINTGTIVNGEGLSLNTNYIARSVKEYQDAGDPMNGQSFQGL